MVGQANAYLALSDLPHALPPLPKSAALANPKFCSGEYHVCNLLKSWFAQGFKPMMGIKPMTTLSLANTNTTKPLQRAFANTTKPLQHHNGLVV
jgi:hypothetical protein